MHRGRGRRSGESRTPAVPGDECLDDGRARRGPRSYPESLTAGLRPGPVGKAVLLPILCGGQAPLGRLLAGVSQRLPLDDAHLDFFGLIAAHIASAVAPARALEVERARSLHLAELGQAKWSSSPTSAMSSAHPYLPRDHVRPEAGAAPLGPHAQAFVSETMGGWPIPPRGVQKARPRVAYVAEQIARRPR
jgi:hypothetical protein